MNKREYLDEIKYNQKEIAKAIRELKNTRKQDKRGDMPLWKIEYKISNFKYEYRHQHIAYCLVRGKSRDVIECPRENNKPNETYIKRLVEKHEEAIRNCQDRPEEV